MRKLNARNFRTTPHIIKEYVVFTPASVIFEVCQPREQVMICKSKNVSTLGVSSATPSGGGKVL